MKFRIMVATALLLLAAMMVSAQYTGFDVEKAKPPTLYPKAGPGESAIIQELQRTNQLLEQNNQLLNDQNRLLKEIMAQRPK